MSCKNSPVLKRFRSALLYRGLLLVGFIGRRVPFGVGQRLGRALGTLAWLVLRRERSKALHNIEAAFPEWTDSQRRDTIRMMFRHLGVSLFEIMWLPNLERESLARTTTLDNLEPSEELIRQGHTVVAFSAHTGNWEWLAYCAGLRVPLTVLQRERPEPGLTDFISAIRSKAGIRTIDRGSAGAGRDLIQAMRNPGMMAFLIDQSIRAESAKVPFFGRPALTPIGPAKLTIRLGAYAVPVFSYRREDGTHAIRFLEPVATKRDDDPVELTGRMTALIEEQIRKVPSQWVWMHDRWRDRPDWDVANIAKKKGQPDGLSQEKR